MCVGPEKAAESTAVALNAAVLYRSPGARLRKSGRQEAIGNAETGCMQNPFFRTLLICGIGFPVLLVVINLLFALFLGGLPNRVQFQAISDLAFLQILWQDNPWETIKLVWVDMPLGVVERLHDASGIQLWGMFYYAGTILVYLLVSAFTGFHWNRLMTGSGRQQLLYVTGVILVVIGVTYLRRAECCTSNPAWALETWLLAKASMPNPGVVNWIDLYQRVQPWLVAIQTGVLMIGLVMLYRWWLCVKPSALDQHSVHGT
jgi:hypothetical protein